MNDEIEQSAPGSVPNFLQGGREMAKAILSKDWSKTGVGPLAGWPQSLRTTVSLCLASNFPISIAWGPQRTQIYNDGYWPICGAKHPHSMGLDFKECWFSAWPVIGEAFERAERGETSFLENQRMFLDRNGYLEETFFTFSFSPIHDETGGIGGLFHPVTETTAKMLTERRTRTLRDLAAHSADAKTIEDAAAAVMAVLAESSLDLPFALLYVFENAIERPALAGSCGFPSGFPNDTAVWPLQEAVAGPILVENLQERFGGLSGGPYREPLQKALVLPVPGLGNNRCAGLLVAGVSTRLPLDEAYRNFYDLLASHIGSAIANARAYREERRKAEALAELDRAKTAFFSNISHEFRTPLTLMLGPLEDLLTRGDLATEARGEVQLVHRNGMRLLKLVNTLLEFSRIEAGRIQAVYEPTDLSQLTRELASAFRSAMEKAHLDMVVDCPPLEEPVYVDREMWEKIVLNLISNAFKFTFEGRILVRLRLTETHAELTVQDTGAGIAAEDLARIFERFHRIQGARSRSHEGTGIGLALVQELARLHGGIISASSQPDTGSTFTVTIPRGKDHLPADRIQAGRGSRSTALGAQPYVDESLRWLPDPETARLGESQSAPLPPRPPESKPAEASVSGKILLADDNADMRDYVLRVLSARYQVHAVADGQAALAFAQQTPVDLVLTDVMMPRVDGFELLHRLRADSRTRAIPIILLSARAGEESRVEGLDAGADDYLVKPFAARELLARVDAHLRLARIRNEAAALHESEIRFRTMSDSAPLLISTCDPHGRFDYFNRQWLDFTGHTLSEELASQWTGRVHPDDHGLLTSRLAAAMQDRQSIELEFRLRGGDDQYVWFLAGAAPRLHQAAEFLGFVLCCVDVNNQKRTQERMQLALEAANAGLGDWNVLTGECFFDPSYHAILGYEEGDLPLQYETWAGLIHPDDRAAILERRLEQIRLHRGHVSYEYRIRKKSGEYIWVQSKSKVTAWTQDEKPARMVGVMTNITERRLLEEQLYQAQRLESVGRLAGGVAHDFNNLLTVISGYVEMLAADLSGVELAQEGLNEIRSAGERAAALTNQLLAFSRNQILQPSVLNLNEVVTDVNKMLGRLIGEDVELLVRLAPDLGNTVADPGQIQQIVMNLAVNSRDAMPGGGTLIVETSNTYLDETYASVHPGVRAGHHVMLAVTDSGHGMPAEVRNHIFEPFFTTKGKGHGTGLGLATVYGIVKQSGGSIWVYSEPGQGTTFKLYFPRTDEPVTAAKHLARTDLRGTEAILLVEDQDEVRIMAIKALKRYGYQVYSAANGDDALRFCRSHQGRLDLVITDVVMPGMNGRELAIQLSASRPDFKFLFMSGYTDNAIAHHGILDQTVDFIQKPFGPESLAEKVREVLGVRGTRKTLLLVVGDDSARALLSSSLVEAGYAVVETENTRQAAETLSQTPHLDLIVAGTEEGESVALLRKAHPKIDMLVLTSPQPDEVLAAVHALLRSGTE